jgi:hypothetical protein
MRLISGFVLLCCTAAVAGAQDTIRIRADNPPLWGANVHLVPTLKVGVADGPREYAFGEIGFFAMRPDGRFYIYDSKDKQIRMYDEAGRFHSKIGRLGDGPGEYRSLEGMAILDDTILAAWDPRNLRMSYFGSTGKLLSSRTLARAPGMFGGGAHGPFGIDNDGLHYFTGFRRGVRDAVGDFQRIHVRFSPAGDLVDTIIAPMTNAGAGAIGDMNFHEATIAARYTGGGLVSGRNDRYMIAFRPSPREKPVVVERTFSRVPVNPEEAAEWDAYARWADRSRPKPNSRVIVPPFEVRPTPRMKPAFRSLWSDADGRVWVEMHVPSVKGEPRFKDRSPITWQEPKVYDVIDRHGVYLGRVELPLNTAIMSARGNIVWVRGSGPDDEPVMTRYAVRSAR